MNIYLAGTFKGKRRGGPSENWRLRIFPDLHDYHFVSDYSLPLATHWRIWSRDILPTWPDGHRYVGPFGEDLSHFTAHGPTAHGAGAGDPRSDIPKSYTGWTRRGDVMAACLAAIRRADVVFAWIDRLDVYGTLAELGYAAALRDLYGSPRIYVGTPNSHGPVVAAGQHNDSELWFALQMADARCRTDDPLEALTYCIQKDPRPNAVRARDTRKAISSAMRFYIIEKYDYTCQYCHRTHRSSEIGPDNRPWHLDHADPLARGGRDLPENLVLSCARCNGRKATKRPGEFRP